jgi:hypothetical protein
VAVHQLGVRASLFEQACSFFQSLFPQRDMCSHYAESSSWERDEMLTFTRRLAHFVDLLADPTTLLLAFGDLAALL